MNIESIRYFVTVTAYRSFTKAAEKLYISQPSLSRHIMTLENEVGFPLLIRNKNKVELTEGGAVFLEKAKRLLEEEQSLMSLMNRYRQGVVGTLRIGFSSALHLDRLAAAVRGMAANNPMVELSFKDTSLSRMTAGLLNGQLDAIITLKDEIAGLANVHSTKLADNYLCATVSENHRLFHQESISIGELAEEELAIIIPEFAPALHNQIIRFCEERGFLLNELQYDAGIEEQFLRLSTGKYIALNSVHGRELFEGERRVIANIPLENKAIVLGPMVVAYRRKNPYIEMFITELLKENNA